MELFEKIAVFLEQNPDRIFTYGEIGDEFETHPKGIGSSMRALGRRGRYDLCERVVKS